MVLILPAIISGGQSEVDWEIIEDRIARLAEDLEDENADYAVFLDQLTYFLAHPINLNRAEKRELGSLGILSEIEIQALIDHRAKFGNLNSTHELQAIEGWSQNTIELVLPFVTVGNETEADELQLQNLQSGGSHDLFLRSSGKFNENGRHFARYRYRFRDQLSLGITAENDPGEAFFERENKGFDFHSGHIQYRGNGHLRELLIGDYQVAFGQGLTLWSGMGLGKSSMAMNIKRVAPGVRPYTSSDENRFMRGAVLGVRKGNLSFTGFLSRKHVDANLVVADSSQNALPIFSSLQQTGYHRTPEEIEDEKSIRETVMGLNAQYSDGALQLGLTVFREEFGGAMQRDLKLYNQFELNRSTYSAAGMDYSFYRYGWHFFGEISCGINGALATLNGVLLSLHPSFSLSVLHRHYPRNYQNRRAAPFAENSLPANENGFYVGTAIDLSRRWKLTAYVDRFRFPWLRYQNDAPTHGFEKFAQLTCKPSRSNQFYIRYRQREKTRNAQEDVAINFPIRENREYLRIHAMYKVSESIKFKTRVEWSRYQLGTESSDGGFLMYHDVTFKKLSFPLSVSLRYAQFDTDSYNARIYAYENDLLYAWSIPAYYGRGSRVYAMIKWDVWKKVDLWVRYSAWTRFPQLVSEGAGIEKTGEVKVQVRWRG